MGPQANVNPWRDWFGEAQPKPGLDDEAIDRGFAKLFEPANDAMLQLVDGYDEDEIREVEMAPAPRVPSDYRALLRAGEGGVGRSGANVLRIYSLSQAREKLWAMAIPLWCRGLVPFGENERGDVFAFLFTEVTDAPAILAVRFCETAVLANDGSLEALCRRTDDPVAGVDDGEAADAWVGHDEHGASD